MCHPQKKPRTRNNEILSSYSSSKFLLTPGQKRRYPSGNFNNVKYFKTFIVIYIYPLVKC